MCGLIAVLGDADRAASLVETGLARMLHRGIRSRIVEFRGGAMGHARLPIVGVGKENDQPVRRGRHVIGYVGEVLDFRETGTVYDCDLPFVADRWADLGPRALVGRDGFWHVVAYDERTDSLSCVVDYLRQKPLYYRADVPAVASEPDALACLGGVTLDRLYLSDVVKWGYCPDPRLTPYEQVKCMLPGEGMTIHSDGRTESVVVDPVLPRVGTPEDLRREIESAVRRRVLSSDVPVAALVSGGLDSAIVWTLASRHGEPRAYHVENGEREQCERVAPGATSLGLSGMPLDRALSYMQEPLDLGSLVPQAAISDAIGASGGERVCLTGDAADELFGGYGRARRYDSQSSDVWRELVCWHLPRLDRVMMRNKIEVRSPFLSRRVVEIATALPRDLRTDKRILRELFRGDLPPGVADVPKRALRTPEVESDRESRSAELVDMFIHRSRGFTDA